MSRFLVVSLLLLVVACAPQMVKVESGERTVGGRLLLAIDGAWNQFDNNPLGGPALIWTMEGLPIDALAVYPGIKDEQLMHAERSGSGQKAYKFQSKMQPEQIVGLFEGMLTRDGSSFTLDRLEPAEFGGEKGFRFRYSLLRKVDGVHLSGVGYAVVSKGELFALVYQAPRLAFFGRHEARVEQIARSARLKM